MPLAPCQNNLWCIDRIDFKWRPAACPESHGTGIYFHYASRCISNKSFSLLGPNTGDSSLWLFFLFFNAFFRTFFTIHRLIGWTRLEFSWHRIFDLDEGFLPNYLLVVCVCEFICVRKKLAKPFEAYLHVDLAVQCCQQIALTHWPIICASLLGQPQRDSCWNHAYESLFVWVSYSHLSSTISVCCFMTLNQAAALLPPYSQLTRFLLFRSSVPF